MLMFKRLMLRRPDRSVTKPESAEGGTRDELAELAKAAIAGDRSALRTLLFKLVPHLLRVSRRVLGRSHPFVEDVAHDAAYTVVNQLAEWRGEASLLNYARRVALLTAMNMRRRDSTQKRASVREGVDTDTFVADDLDPEELAASAAVLPLVRKMLDALPDPLAETFALNVLLGYTVAEIATLSDVPLETVRSRLRLAKNKLRSRALKHPILSDLAGPNHER